MQMKIGFDASQIGQNKTGCGYFALSLLNALASIDKYFEYILYPTFGDHYWEPKWKNPVSIIRQKNFRRGLGHHTYDTLQMFWRYPPQDLENLLGDPDIIHANNFYCPTTLKKARLVYTLHDLAFIEQPEHTLEETRVASFNGALYASLYSDRIIAVSEYTRGHFLKVFPYYPADKILVVYEGSRFSFKPRLSRPNSLPTYLMSNSFWLNVGTLEPRKNHFRLLQAYAKLKAEQLDILPLVLVGARGWLMNDFEKLIEDLGIQSDVIILGYVDDNALQWLYQNCFACIYPSLFEGFGLPVLEAMSLGAAVITSNVTSIPEVVGDAGLLIDPYSPNEICEAMKNLLRDNHLRNELRAKAQTRSLSFSWETTARKVLSIYESLV